MVAAVLSLESGPAETLLNPVADSREGPAPFGWGFDLMEGRGPAVELLARQTSAGVAR